MFNRFAAVTGLALAVAAMASCNRSVPEEYAPAPPPASEAPPPVLAGGPPVYEAGPGATMAPIPNPGDLSPAERARVYGPGRQSNMTRPPVMFRRDDGTTVVTMAPIPNPEDLSAAERRRIYGSRRVRPSDQGYATRRAAPSAPYVAPPATPSYSEAASPLPGPQGSSSRPMADDVAAAGDTGVPAAATAPEAPRPARKPFKWPNIKLPKLGSMDDWKMPNLGRIDMSNFELPGMPGFNLPGVGKVASNMLVALLMLLVAFVALVTVAKNATKRRVRSASRRHGGLFGGHTEHKPDHGHKADHGHGHAEPHHA